jgi:hypothetical protein
LVSVLDRYDSGALCSASGWVDAVIGPEWVRAFLRRRAAGAGGRCESWPFGLLEGPGGRVAALAACRLIGLGGWVAVDQEIPSVLATMQAVNPDKR